MCLCVCVWCVCVCVCGVFVCVCVCVVCLCGVCVCACVCACVCVHVCACCNVHFACVHGLTNVSVEEEQTGLNQHSPTRLCIKENNRPLGWWMGFVRKHGRKCVQTHHLFFILLEEK